MSNLGPWINGTVEHVKQHWQAHLLPVVILFMAIMVMSVVMTGLYMVAGLVAAIAGGVMGSEVVMLLLMVVCFGLATLLSLGLGFAIAPLWVGYIRQAIKLHRGEPTGNDDLTWGSRNLGKVLPLILLQGAIGLLAAMACYFPAFLVGVALFFSMPILADRELGAIDCMKASWELARPHFLELLVLLVVLGFASVVLAYIPIVGSLLSLIAAVALLVVVYDDLAQRDLERRSGA